MTTFQIAALIAIVVSIPAALYALHRLCLYLEAADLLYYIHKRPQSGSLSSSLVPFQELLLQPEIRHVRQYKEDRAVDDESGDGDK